MDGRRGRTGGEVSTKATVDPNAALIITPGVVPGARRTAALVDEVSTKAGFGRAAMALAIFGRAVEALLSLGSTGEQQQESGCGDKLKVGAETGIMGSSTEMKLRCSSKSGASSYRFSRGTGQRKGRLLERKTSKIRTE